MVYAPVDFTLSDSTSPQRRPATHGAGGAAVPGIPRGAKAWHPKPKFRRVLLKLSGEGLMGDQPYGLDSTMVERVSSEIREVSEMGVQICLVVGGGNIFRGVSGAADTIERSAADHMGMLATVINALALQSVLEANGMQTRVLSAIPMSSVCEPYIRRRAVRHMEKGRIVIFAAGTGNPLFHHRHGGRPACLGDGVRRPAQGNPGGRCL